MDRPVGSDGWTSHVSTVPPKKVGTPVVIEESMVSTYGLPVYESEDGISSLMVMSIVVVALPPVLLA